METLRAVLFSFVCASCITTSAAKPRICSLPLKSLCSSQTIAETCKVAELCPQKYQAQMHVSHPVNITLYYESLDPSSLNFINTQLDKAVSIISEIMNLGLVPYGDATETKQGNLWNFTCRHGPQECERNIIETCAISMVNNTKRLFRFIECMGINDSLPFELAKDCAVIYLMIPPDDILLCANGTKGNQLEHQMALKTAALKPPHQFVPWITLNGNHTQAIQAAAMKDLIQLICSNYTGPKPPGCSKQLFTRFGDLY